MYIFHVQVKDRFCTLLSQRVSQLQNRLASLESETQDGEVSSESTTTAHPQQEVSELNLCVCVTVCVCVCVCVCDPVAHMLKATVDTYMYSV